MKHITRILVLTGFLMTISSILITQLIIADYRDDIAHLSSEIKDRQDRINLVWQNENRTEYIGNTALMWMLLSESQDAKTIAKQVIDNQLSALNIKTHKPNEITSALKASRDETVSTVDTLYSEKIDLKEEQAALNGKLSFLNNIALFLQAVGLLLILSRDILSRRD